MKTLSQSFSFSSYFHNLINIIKTIPRIIINVIILTPFPPPLLQDQGAAQLCQRAQLQQLQGEQYT